jgi:endonuclease YncB( thermonuclease family)
MQMKLFIISLLFSLNALSNVGDFSLDNYKSLYVVDGDSVSLKMRIAGIDTPETAQKCRKRRGKMINCGRIAKNYLRQLLKNTAGKITIEPVGIGHYKRILVNIFKGDINIAQRMVEAGMAYAYGDTYEVEAQIAKDKKRGFWGFDTPPINPYKWRKMNRR